MNAGEDRSAQSERKGAAMAAPFLCPQIKTKRGVCKYDGLERYD